MLKCSAIISSVIILGAVSLTGTIYTSEDCFEKTDVKTANKTFEKELKKIAKRFFSRKRIVNKGQKKFVEDFTVLRYLIYFYYKFTGMDDQAIEKYENSFRDYYYDYLGRLVLDKREKFDENELDDELDNLDKFFAKEPDFLLSQEFTSIKSSTGQNLSLLNRRFLQKICKGELSKETLLEEDKCYYEKEPKKRLKKIKKILTQYRGCFEGSGKQFMKKTATWGPKTEDESLLAREVIYSLFEMVRSGNENLEFPFENARKYGLSRFAFAS